MEGGLPEEKGANKEVLPGEADRSRGCVGTTAPGGPSKARNRQENGYCPLSFLVLTPHLHLLLLPHVLVLPPDPLPLFSLYSLFTALSLPATTNPLPQPTCAGRHSPSCELLFIQRRALFP